MIVSKQVGMNSYSMIGDIAVIAICIVILIFLGSSYVIKNKSYRIFFSIVGLVFSAGVVNIVFNLLLQNTAFVINSPYSQGILYFLRVFYHSLLFGIFFAFILYAVVISNMEHKRARFAAVSAAVIAFLIVAVDVVLTLTGTGYVIDKETGQAAGGSNAFMIGFVLFALFLAVLLFRIRTMVYKRVLLGFYATMAVSLIIRFAQIIMRQSSLTTMTFVFPVLAMLYYVHINPYDTNIGTLDSIAMEDMVKNLNAKKKPFIFISLLLPEFISEGKLLPDYINDLTRRFTDDYFRSGTLFKIGNGQIVMIISKRVRQNDDKWFKTVFSAFSKQYQIYKHPYKIVYGDTFNNMIHENDCLSLINITDDMIPENTIYRIEEKDILRFQENKYIVEQLEDIHRKGDLDDPRVKVFFQPVYNVQTKHFDTAEALMRLELEKTGTVSPVIFIPIAESRGYIHTLTRIILNKTCQTIRKLLDDACSFERISINVSALELKDEAFCDDIYSILSRNGVPKEKIAIELTESQNDEDFIVMKEKIGQLHVEGIKFYLDDFGTGYSNIERILELPFDIIKFDRSMVNAIRNNERSEYIVKEFAKVFSTFNYSVLFEGVEDSDDENRCIDMSAAYLQGFKFSKPIPVDQLADYFSQEEQ